MSKRTTFGAWVLALFIVVAAMFAVSLYALAPAAPAVRGPILLSAFIVILIASLLCILFFLRWMLRPYRQLVGEAERAPGVHPHKSQDEAQFVLETFQSIVAQLQSQQKELERLTAQASERAASAERFSDRIVASVPSGLIAFDANGRALVINSPGRAILEVDGEVAGQPSNELLKNLPQLAELVETCLRTGTVFRREEIQPTANAHKRRRLGATVAPIDLVSERGAICLLTDITEVTELREQVALKRNLESLGEMSAGLAHEFKNAIATLHGYAQLMQNLNLDEPGNQATNSLLKEVRNLSILVNAFLNFARPQPLDLEEVSLTELLTDCAKELESVYDSLQIKLDLSTSLNGDDKPIMIQADERMLRQAVINLLRNAAEAIPEEQAERRVTVTSSRRQDGSNHEFAQVEISDTGVGIPNSDLQRIFIPFFTTKASGHGIGLALTHRVITEHGGSLNASNSPDGGAVFTLQLPLSAAN
ncbi:MAG TPA: ATP-binding protein [Pyrinomonadaceae bacterium]|nr:ATP-binding protein [Pyrinomonadaceae bacterium]